MISGRTLPTQMPFPFLSLYGLSNPILEVAVFALNLAMESPDNSLKVIRERLA
jgi:uncharacterized membrane protein